MSTGDVTRLVYRSILRWAQAAEGVPFAVRDRHVKEVFPQLANAQLGLQNALFIRKLTQSSFRNNADMDESDAAVALDDAFLALQLLNTYYANLLLTMRKARLLHTDRHGVLFPIGQVFLHRKHGYAGVIHGFDHQCKLGEDWAEKMNVKHDQPFYAVLPDENDCQRLYGSVRITKYVGQENIMPVQVPRRITHRLLEDWFKGYSPSHLRYVPNEPVQFQYPDDYDFQDEVSCREDTNLLKLPGDEKLPSSGYRSVDHIRQGLEEFKKALADFKPE